MNQQPNAPRCHLVKPVACVPPHIRHSLVASVQIGKQKETSPAPPLPLRWMPASRRVGRAITTRRDETSLAGEKRTKLKRILRRGYRLSLLAFSFLTRCRPAMSRGGGGGGAEGASRGGGMKGGGGHRGRPDINYTFVHLWLTLG